jgi:hypothetical protein
MLYRHEIKKKYKALKRTVAEMAIFTFHRTWDVIIEILLILNENWTHLCSMLEQANIMKRFM